MASLKSIEMTSQERSLLVQAKRLLTKHFKTRNGLIVNSPSDVKEYLQLCFVGRMDKEHVDILLLDSIHRLIRHENLAKGTIDACPIYPREVVELVIKHKAKAVILTHNHPSGEVVPSEKDIQVTRRIKEALGLIDCAVLDHFIVGDKVVSMIEVGVMP